MSEEMKQRSYRLTQKIYDKYGTFTGHLFGISPDFRGSVQSIVLCVLENIECSNEGVVLK